MVSMLMTDGFILTLGVKGREYAASIVRLRAILALVVNSFFVTDHTLDLVNDHRLSPSILAIGTIPILRYLTVKHETRLHKTNDICM